MPCGKVDGATLQRYYTKITQLYPGDWEAHYHLGQCLLELGDPRGASSSLEIANTVVPTNIEVGDLLAESYLAAGDENKLFTFLEQQATEQQTVRAWTRFAEYAMAISDPDNATMAINTAIALDAGDDILSHTSLRHRLQNSSEMTL